MRTFYASVQIRHCNILSVSSLFSFGSTYTIDTSFPATYYKIRGNLIWLYFSLRDCLSEVMCAKVSPNASLYAAGLANGLIKVSVTRKLYTQR